LSVPSQRDVRRSSGWIPRCCCHIQRYRCISCILDIDCSIGRSARTQCSPIQGCQRLCAGAVLIDANVKCFYRPGVSDGCAGLKQSQGARHHHYYGTGDNGSCDCFLHRHVSTESYLESQDIINIAVQVFCTNTQPLPNSTPYRRTLNPTRYLSKESPKSTQQAFSGIHSCSSSTIPNHTHCRNVRASCAFLVNKSDISPPDSSFL